MIDQGLVLQKELDLGLGSLTPNEKVVYYISNAFTWTSMEGLGGYITGYNHAEFPEFINSLRAIGAKALAGEFNELLHEINRIGGIGGKRVDDEIFSEFALGMMVDDLSDKFIEYYDEWQAKLDAFCENEKFG